MEERNITITLDKAKEWYNSGNNALKEVALQAFDENKLITNFKNITTFRKACDALNINYNTVSIIINRTIKFNKPSAARAIPAPTPNVAIPNKVKDPAKTVIEGITGVNNAAAIPNVAKVPAKATNDFIKPSQEIVLKFNIG